ESKRVIEALVRHERRYGAEHFDPMDDLGLVRRARAEQRGLRASSDRRIGVDQRLRTALVKHIGLRAQLLDAALYRFVLRTAYEPAHAPAFAARVADRDTTQLSADGFGGRVV